MQGYLRPGVIARFALAAALAALAGCGGSSPSNTGTSNTGAGGTAQSTPAPAPPPIVVPAGTVIVVTVDQSIGTKSSQAGDKFAASLAAPVTVDGREVIPQGAKAAGHVTVSDQAGRVDTRDDFPHIVNPALARTNREPPAGWMRITQKATSSSIYADGPRV